MKGKKIYIAAAILFIGLVAIAWAATPAPPVNQNIGLGDILEVNVSTNTCKQCHTTAPSDLHHFMIAKKNTNLGCPDCHPNQGTFPNQVMYIERTCNNCHNGTAFWANPVVNLATIRPPGKPHHNQTKNSSSSGVPLAYLAINRQCNACHGSGFVANYDDGHYVPTYATGMVTPLADFKINSTVSGDGREWGGCAACHDAGVEAGMVIPNNHDTHHGETSGMLGRQCNYCHVSSGVRAEPIPDWSPDPSASPLRVWLNQSYPSYVSLGWDTSIRHIELRNSTILNMGDTVNGTGCEKCHSVATLHNIQADAANTIANEIPGYGHIANDSDCNGCHQGWSSATDNPYAGPNAMVLDSIAPSKLTANVATDVTITGSNFVQAGYTTAVLVDGVSTAPTSITDTAVVVTVNLAVGSHNLQVEKGGVTSVLTTVMALAPGTITSAKLTNGVITIDGTGLGAEQQAVVITKADGRLVASDSITSSTDTQIVAVSASAEVGDTVTVETPTGAATATIIAGTVTPAITVTSPNGGESWKRGTTHAITWTTAGITGENVKIDLLKGTTVTTIAQSAPNSGSYTWKIFNGQSVATNYKIRITSTSNPAVTDSSDGNFQISK